MKNEENYWVNGFWFDMYEEAKRYADFILETQRHYYAIFTKAEIEANRELFDKVNGTVSKDQENG